MQQKIQNLIKNLKQFFDNNNFQKGVVGISGGVDSALTTKIAVAALGKENVIGILMPATTTSSSQNFEDAKALVKELGIEYHIVSIDDFIKPFDNLDWGKSDLADMNIRARARMMILYHYANTCNAIVLGTGNRTEIELGYGTKYGDFGVDVEVLGTLWKTEVFEMAKEIGLAETFYTKAPSAELHEGQTDEKEIGASYEVIDRIYQNDESGIDQIDNPKIVGDILKRREINKHKTEPLPIIQS